MFTALLQWDILKRIVLNTLFVSIPEEFYLVMFTLILMGEFNYWKERECKKLFDRWDYIRVFVPVIIGAVISNILRYTGSSIIVICSISMISMFITIVLTGDIWMDANSLKWMWRAFSFLLLGIFTLIAMESIYVPVFLYVTGKTLAEINRNILLNIVLSMPMKLLQLIILFIAFTWKRNLLKISIARLMFENNTMAALSLVSLSSNILFFIVMLKAVLCGKSLFNFAQDFKVLILLLNCIVPIINILTFLLCTYYVKYKETDKQNSAAEKLGKIVEDISVYKDSGKYENIQWKLNEIQKNVESAYKDLCSPK